MVELSCTECGTDQEVSVDRSTYYVVCDSCSSQFEIPREYRHNKAELQEYKSSVNIRLGFQIDGSEMVVGWTVQSAEKGNQYLEKDSARVDVSDHPEMLHWYIALFKCLQRTDDYKQARIWIKDKNVMDHLSGESTIEDSDPREGMKERICAMAADKFYGCEFGTTDTVGQDIRSMVSRGAT